MEKPKICTQFALSFSKMDTILTLIFQVASDQGTEIVWGGHWKTFVDMPRAKRKLRLGVARPQGGVVDWQNVRPQKRGQHVLTGRITAQHWAGKV